MVLQRSRERLHAVFGHECGIMSNIRAALCVLLIFLFSAPARGDHWTVSQFRDPVLYKVGEEDWRNVTQGMTLPNAAWVYTGPKGRVTGKDRDKVTGTDEDKKTGKDKENDNNKDKDKDKETGRDRNKDKYKTIMESPTIGRAASTREKSRNIRQNPGRAKNSSELNGNGSLGNCLKCCA